MSVIAPTGPWYLLVGLDGRALRVVDKGVVVAGVYYVVEVVPSAATQGAVEESQRLRSALDVMTADRDSWKALAGELLEQRDEARRAIGGQ